MQKALITGASSGIGKELAYIMASKGHDLVLAARNIDELNKVKNEITKNSKVNIRTHSSDLSQSNSASLLYKELKNENIEILINNAGVGLKGDFFNDDINRTMQMAQLNMISLMELTQFFGKDFIKNNTGKILNVGSITAFLPGPKQPVYYATKAFVRSLSRALAYNTRNTNVTITTLHPGVTNTKFFNSSNAANFKGGASAESVALLGYSAMMSGKVEVTHGVSNKFLTNIFVRLVPYRLQSYIVDRASDV